MRFLPSNKWLRRSLLLTGAGLTGGLAAYMIVDRMLSAPRYRGAPTDHFDGEKFRNLEPAEQKGFIKFFLKRFAGGAKNWHEWRDFPPGPPPPRRVSEGRLRVTFVNHATVLIQMDGVNILTDPVWSERASPVTWAGPRRHRPPGLRFDDLPPIDVVLLSHNHYDHLDTATLVRLVARGQPQIIVGLGNRALLEEKGIPVSTELDWWQGVEAPGGLRVTSVPTKHFSGRGLSDRNATLWCGHVIQGPSGNIFFAGDTAAGAHFEQIRDRFAPIRLALIPIGAYLPRDLMSPVHMSPAEAVRAHEILGSRTSVAIHYGTFQLSEEGEDEPVAELNRVLEKADEGVAPFRVLDFGEGRDVP